MTLQEILSWILGSQEVVQEEVVQEDLGSILSAYDETTERLNTFKDQTKENISDNEAEQKELESARQVLAKEYNRADSIVKNIAKFLGE